MNSKRGTKTINIATDFSEYPAGRFVEDGDYNGTTFRKQYLIPALENSESVCVIFDGVAGFGSSFLEEAFGGLIHSENWSKNILDERMHITTNEPELQIFVDLAKRFIDDADKLKVSNVC